MTIKPYEKPVAILDIGSNSVRLDIRYNAEPNAPVLVRRRSLCRLGKLTQKGFLAKTRMAYAMNRLKKFANLIKSNDVDIYRAVATSAIREAKNGPDFLAEIKKETGLNVEVISGDQEAELMAIGVTSSFIHPITGVIADLGGGSLELVQVKDSQIQNKVSLEIGVHRYRDTSSKAAEDIASKLDAVGWLKGTETLYVVGGSWRSCARLDMTKKALPTDDVQGYAVSSKDVAGFCDWLTSGQFEKDVPEDAIEQHRLKELPVAALVLKALAQDCGAPDVVVSQGGVREGAFAELIKTVKKAA